MTPCVWSSRDVVDAVNNVVIPRQQTATLAEFKAAFAANPTKYPGAIHTNNGIKTYVGSSGAQPAGTRSSGTSTAFTS